MKLIRIIKDFYANIDHISEIGLDHRTNEWFIKILGDDDLVYVSEEEAMELIQQINSNKQ